MPRPFSELTGDAVEQTVTEWLAGHGRVALTGPIGSGKSSIARSRPSPARALLRIATDGAAQDQLFRGFFGDVLRELADNLECALLVAAHDEYRTKPGYSEMTDGIIRHLAVPALTKPAQIGAVITARAEFLDEAATWEDLLRGDALELLSVLHLAAHHRSLRLTLTKLREALSSAAADGSELVSAAHIEAAEAG